MGESTLFVDDQLGLQVVNLALREGLISPEEWTEALAQQSIEAATGRPSRSICAILLSRGTLTRSQLGELRKKAEVRPRLRRPLPSPPPPPPRPTRESATFGKYLLLHELGQGGRGVVYEALDQELGRRVALKLLRDTPGADPGAAAQEREWFLRESRVTATLPRHPSIVQVHETGVTRGTRYIAMELVHGLEMNRWAEGRDRRAHVALLRDAARALHEAHEYGIVHRDLKPKNILVDAAGRPHLTDFGTARSVRQDSRSSLEAWGAMVGTALYLSPELAQGAAGADRRSDVYALGVMLYEALTGSPPFEGDTVFSTFMKAMRKEVPRPSAVVDPAGPRAVDRTIEAICLKAMARQARDRYATAADLADDLDAWLSGSRVRIGSPLSRRTAAIAAGIAAATALCGFLLFTRTAPAPARADGPVPAPAPEPPLLPGTFRALAPELDALRPGLVGEVFEGAAFGTFVARRIDPSIAFDWEKAAPPAGVAGPFSVRWTGLLRAPRAGRYRLESRNVRLTLGGRAAAGSVRVDLEEGFHRIVLECSPEAGHGSVSFACLEERADGRLHPLGPESLFHP